MTSREKIIISAEKLFWQKGYKNTSIADILKHSEVNKGSFFQHFKDKKILFISVIDYFYEKEMIPLFETHFKNDESPKKQIINFCKDINSTYQKYNFKGGCLLGNMSLELADIDEAFREKLNEVFDNWKNELIKVLEKIKTKTAPEKIADYIIWGIEGLTLTGKVHKQKNKNNSEFEMFINILNSLIN